jgi:hypothetical protein
MHPSTLEFIETEETLENGQFNGSGMVPRKGAYIEEGSTAYESYFEETLKTVKRKSDKLGPGEGGLAKTFEGMTIVPAYLMYLPKDLKEIAPGEPVPFESEIVLEDELDEDRAVEENHDTFDDVVPKIMAFIYERPALLRDLIFIFTEEDLELRRRMLTNIKSQFAECPFLADAKVKPQISESDLGKYIMKEIEIPVRARLKAISPLNEKKVSLPLPELSVLSNIARRYKDELEEEIALQSMLERFNGVEAGILNLVQRYNTRADKTEGLESFYTRLRIPNSRWLTIDEIELVTKLMATLDRFEEIEDSVSKLVRRYNTRVDKNESLESFYTRLDIPYSQRLTLEEIELIAKYEHKKLEHESLTYETRVAMRDAEFEALDELKLVDGVVKVLSRATVIEDGISIPAIIAIDIPGLTLEALKYKDPLKELLLHPTALMEFADLIDYLHKIGIIHKDIKPNNIVWGEDKKLHLIDFGPSLIRTKKGRLYIGFNWSPPFSTPQMGSDGLPMSGVDEHFGKDLTDEEYAQAIEKMKSVGFDHTSDLYALALVFYVLKYKNKPFISLAKVGAENYKRRLFPRDVKDTDFLEAMTNTNDAVLYKPPGMTNDEYEIYAKATARNPEDRFQNAKDLMVALLKVYKVTGTLPNRRT